jgi:hypothetical protein
MHRRAALLLAFSFLFVAGCGDISRTLAAPDGPELHPASSAAFSARAGSGAKAPTAKEFEQGVQQGLEDLNRTLASRSAPFRVQRVEWLSTAAGAATGMGQTVFAHDRNLRFDTRWVPDDPRRPGSGLDLRHADFDLAPAGPGTPALAPLVEQAFDTFIDEPCTALRVRGVGVPDGINPSQILPSELIGDPSLETPPLPVADIVTLGFVPGDLVDDLLGPGAAAFVLGVTFHFVFVDATGMPTDLDGDRLLDSSYKEIWYNADVLWDAGAGPGVDLFSVVLHEVGHGLELDHFGRIFLAPGNGALRVSPRAVMNAAYLGVQRELLGTDRAAYCGVYANWPGEPS